MAPVGRVLVYGGRGALGSSVVDAFKAKEWWVCNVDLALNENASANVLVTGVGSDFEEQAKQVTSAVAATLENEKLDAIFCVAGGWAGGNAASEDFVRSCDAMWKQSVWSSVIAAQIAAKHMKEGAIFQLSGAKAALDYTPGMMGYGMAKAAVHQFTASLNSSRSGLPKRTTVIATLPITLDTPVNRKNMPKADTSTWTPLSFIAEKFVEWSSEPDSRPASGSLIELITKDGKTDLVIGQLQQPTKLAGAY